MQFLRQNTSATVSIGPFVQSAAGTASATGLSSPTNALVLLNGTTLIATFSPAWTEDSVGAYHFTHPATVGASTGRLRYVVPPTANNLIAWEDFVVLDPTTYDFLFSGGTVGANVKQIGGNTSAVTLDANSLLKVCASDWNGSAITGGFPVSGNVTVGGYAAGQDPATLILLTPTNKLYTDLTGRVKGLDSGGNAFVWSITPVVFGSTSPGAITAASFAANAITGTSIANGALNGKGDWSTLDIYDFAQRAIVSGTQGTQSAFPFALVDGSPPITPADGEQCLILFGDASDVSNPNAYQQARGTFASNGAWIKLLPTDHLTAIPASGDPFTLRLLPSTNVNTIQWGGSNVGAMPGPTGGNGAYAVTTHVSDGTNNLAGATVRFTGAMLPTPNLITDSGGNAAFGLNSGTYRATAWLGGFLPYSGTQSISGSATIQIVLTASILPVAGVGQVLGQLQTYDGQGNFLPGAQVQFELVSSNNGTNQASFSREIFTGTSDGGANMTVVFEQNSTYRGRRLSTSGHGPWMQFGTPTNGTTFALPQILGYLGT